MLEAAGVFFCSGGFSFFGEGLGRGDAGGSIDVEVGDDANQAGAERADEDVAFLQAGYQIRSAQFSRCSENKDVGFDSVEIDRDAFHAGERLCEEACVGVIFVQPAWALFERDETGGGQDAGLSHSTAKSLAEETGPVHELGRAGKHGANGRSQPLRQAEHHGVESMSDSFNICA